MYASRLKKKNEIKSIASSDRAQTSKQQEFTHTILEVIAEQ